MQKSGVLHEKVETIKKRLEEMGVIIVDETRYNFERYYKGGRVVVITGYIPEKAALFIVAARTWTRMDFSISGLLRAKNRIITCENKSTYSIVDDCFIKFEEPELSDLFVNSDWLKNGDLYINYAIDGSSHEKLIEKGISFFSKFLEKYGTEFETRFTRKINLNIIPTESDQFAKMRSEKGMDATLRHFEGIITMKLPKGFYPT